MWIIGDVHAEFGTYLWMVNDITLSKNLKKDLTYFPPEGGRNWENELAEALRAREKTGYRGLGQSLQLGDFGIFTQMNVNMLNANGFSDISGDHKVMRGNHDNPSLISGMPNYLGDWGYRKNMDMFYVGGGFSIDRYWRTEGANWWADEEISYGELHKAVEMFADVKPKIMISHECPTVVKKYVLTNPLKEEITSRTEHALQQMWEAHKPEIWVFGHHHVRRDIFDSVTCGTYFVCLSEMISSGTSGTMWEIPGLKWS
jgi:hypothetical protein